MIDRGAWAATVTQRTKARVDLGVVACSSGWLGYHDTIIPNSERKTEEPKPSQPSCTLSQSYSLLAWYAWDSAVGAVCGALLVRLIRAGVHTYK
jgi:hypothetical protein